MNTSQQQKSNIDSENSFILDWFVTVGIVGIELEPEMDGIDRSQLGFYIQIGTVLQDVLVLSSG